MSVYPLLLLLLTYAFGGVPFPCEHICDSSTCTTRVSMHHKTVPPFLPTESRALASVEQLVNQQSDKPNREFRSESESRPFSQWKGIRSPEKMTPETKRKRQQLGKPLGERPEDLARDVNEALKDSAEGGDESPSESQWVISNPEDRYHNTYREGPDGQELYEVRDPSPATFVYREYPEAVNDTAGDGMGTYGMKSLREENGYDQSEDVLMPISNAEIQNYEDLDLGENVPESEAKRIDTTPYADGTADGALPLSANQIKGSFKINQGVVTGEGNYEVNSDGVDVRVKLHIKTRSKVGPTNGGLEGGYGFRRGHFDNKRNLGHSVS